MIRDDFVSVARGAAALLRNPAVKANWHKPSALPEFRVSGLAGHLAFQVLVLPDALKTVPAEETIPLLEHYNRAQWIGEPLDSQFNTGIREGGERIAANGPEDLAAKVEAAIGELEFRDGPARLPFWGPYSLTTDDLLITRMMELVVHADDLAFSVGVETPEFPPGAVEAVVDLLSRIAIQRHGATNVIRALSRNERAPENIAGI
ncbi:hypothetical protein Lesp02_10290 [Lentzea sp. NBRC 105346]|uniref:maleylpyruvate isomerase N-terminal domain-containing protein n=1 Tax=Lentzea sp. NBRC 105346 TaxID=3032205 RepID=UPI0024A52747|nr:maleylpyruvate isomerase N-terminal domain-containing protein [Lentzea sp. NBRC 105346]GLZ28839.1 hypothetical protein Lesp02_10290 [Lentzea sp. NBRC 105346]